MLGTPQQNGVSEMHNQTLMDMDRSMLNIHLYMCHWGCRL